MGAHRCGAAISCSIGLAAVGDGGRVDQSRLEIHVQLTRKPSIPTGVGQRAQPGVRLLCLLHMGERVCAQQVPRVQGLLHLLLPPSRRYTPRLSTTCPAPTAATRLAYGRCARRESPSGSVFERASRSSLSPCPDMCVSGARAAGEAGDIDHLASSYLLANEIAHGNNLRKSPGLQVPPHSLQLIWFDVHSGGAPWQAGTWGVVCV